MNDASLVAADWGPAQRDGTDGGGRLSYPLAFALLFVTYALAAWGGLSWTIIDGAASPIWPAAGIGLAGLLLGGRSLFPALIAGLTVAALLSGSDHPWWGQPLIGVGNALAAVAATTLIHRIRGSDFHQLSVVKDVLLLLGAAALASTFSGLWGAATLYIAGVVPAAKFGAAALTWLLGDLVGILSITAIILTTTAQSRAHDRLIGRLAVAPFAASLLTVVALGFLVFLGPHEVPAWAIYPALVWVALVGRVQGASLALLMVCVFACAGTLIGSGPFAAAGASPDIGLLQQYLAVTVVTTLLLAAAIDEGRAESRLRQIAADEVAARRELQRTTSLLNLIGDALPSCIYAKDVEGRFIYANRALLNLYRRPASQVLGHTDLDVSDPSEAEVFRANDRRVIASGVADEVEEELTIGDEVHTFLSIKAPLRDDTDAIIGIVGVSTDVTEARRQRDELRRLARRAEIAQRAARSSLYEYDVATDTVTRDPTIAELCDIPRHQLGPGQSEWERHIHPEDLAAFKNSLAKAFEKWDRFALEYRVIGRDGRITWISDTGTIVRGDDGTVEQVIGLVTDVTLQKAADERERLLAREVDHRAKNLLAVVQSVVQLTRADTGDELKVGITGRIQSLARAHSLLADARWEGVELMGLAQEEVAPYTETQDSRITLAGPRIILKPSAAQSIALVLHELATNAAKYGALSSDLGRLELSWCVEKEGGLLLVWQERGGPPGRETAPESTGFGSRLIKASLERQLRGSVSYDWKEVGLTVTMTVGPEFLSLVERGTPGQPG